jgi:hypothetical protein
MINQPILDEVARFRDDLERTSGWDDLRVLWRRNVPPFRVRKTMPTSAPSSAPRRPMALRSSTPSGVFRF